ncbi:flagellar protein [Paenibacillus psychroresistens]|uniref:Flagellar protein n=1 Tax=Paenibacillus psychroresistens TaxID=1778678 RepID=A0A6B8RG97_9BACL|nr:flagellar protein [Paenibacillus psychroresistens]QGQ94605.1 flagellar protein [Paenibacillus psychroresistens]
MNLNVANCPNCGVVYQKNFRNMCMSCSSVSDDQLNRCTKYLWKNPKSTTEEVSLALDVEPAIIIKFIKKGAISKVFPNLTYPCDSCGNPITDNRLCGKCAGNFRDLAHQIANPKPLFKTSGFKIGDRLRS